MLHCERPVYLYSLHVSCAKTDDRLDGSKVHRIADGRLELLDSTKPIEKLIVDVHNRFVAPTYAATGCAWEPRFVQNQPKSEVWPPRVYDGVDNVRLSMGACLHDERAHDLEVGLQSVAATLAHCVLAVAVDLCSSTNDMCTVAAAAAATAEEPQAEGPSSAPQLSRALKNPEYAGVINSVCVVM